MALKTSLVSLWELSEASGTRNDSHGTNHLTDGSSVGRVAGKYSSYGARFASASTDLLSIADNPSLSMVNETFSIAFWCRITGSTGIHCPLGKYNNDTDNREYCFFFNFYSTNTFGFVISSDGQNPTVVDAGTFGSPAVDGTQWCWVYGQFEYGVGLSISVNNGAMDFLSHTGSLFSGNSDFQIGVMNNIRYADADIQQVGIWRKLLSSDDRAAIYNGGNGLAYSSWDASSSSAPISLFEPLVIGASA